jgi:hypothetical protein
VIIREISWAEIPNGQTVSNQNRSRQCPNFFLAATQGSGVGVKRCCGWRLHGNHMVSGFLRSARRGIRTCSQPNCWKTQGDNLTVRILDLQKTLDHLLRNDHGSRDDATVGKAVGHLSDVGPLTLELQSLYRHADIRELMSIALATVLLLLYRCRVVFSRFSLVSRSRQGLVDVKFHKNDLVDKLKASWCTSFMASRNCQLTE